LRNFLNTILFYLNIIAGILLLLSYLSTYISPAKIWVLAFFGLAYPYILLLNLLFLVYYIIRWKRKFLLSLIIILLGFNHLNNFIPIRLGKKYIKGQEKEGGNEIKILSFNVRAFNIYEWYSNPATAKGILNLIQSEHPDVICLQEYYTSSKLNYQPENIYKLFKETPYHYIHYSIQNGLNSGYGIATFSKFPIIHKGLLSFKETSNEVIYTDLTVRGDTIRIYNNHLQSVNFQKRNYDFIDTLKLKYDEENIREIKDISLKLKTAFVKRSQQVDSISSHISHCPYPVLVCGDFNDTPVSYTYRKMKKGLKDAFLLSGKGIGNTYFRIFPSFRIDYIFHSKEFEPMLFEKVEAKLSDHYPIICILDIKK
jgi:endonuclease/exonuclease/phosphatase family metal-dependent hydrolase